MPATGLRQQQLFDAPGLDLTQRELPTAAVIRHPVVRLSVGADLVATHAGAEHLAAPLVDGTTRRGFEVSSDADLQYESCHAPVRVLVACSRFRLDACRAMAHHHTRVGLSDVLAAGPGRPGGEDLDVALVEGEAGFRKRLEDRHRDGGRVDTAAPLAGRNALPAMAAGFTQQGAQRVLFPLERQGQSTTRLEDLDPGALALGEVDVDAGLARDQEFGVTAALAGADFDENFHGASAQTAAQCASGIRKKRFGSGGREGFARAGSALRPRVAQGCSGPS